MATIGSATGPRSMPRQPRTATWWCSAPMPPGTCECCTRGAGGGPRATARTGTGREWASVYDSADPSSVRGGGIAKLKRGEAQTEGRGSAALSPLLSERLRRAPGGTWGNFAVRWFINELCTGQVVSLKLWRDRDRSETWTQSAACRFEDPPNV